MFAVPPSAEGLQAKDIVHLLREKVAILTGWCPFRLMQLSPVKLWVFKIDYPAIPHQGIKS